ncbi:histidine phosphatase family protein [Streptomyces sp. NPDC001250]|uniref:histidine phosphatase family protein n=1 Tax=Streptomyces sp. NPDC001250 TaxID=3154382 RepID=UPI00332E9041
MPLLFLRHGESQANEQNRFAGRLDTPLTALGSRQADQAAERVAALAASGVRIDEVHMSTLQRARQTAWTIIDRLPQPPDRITVDEALTERDFGVYSGRNKSLVKKTIGFAGYTEAFHSPTGRPPGGESWREMYDRVAAYYEDVLLPASRAGRTVLVVAHKYVVEMFALVVADASPDTYRDFKIPNARPLSEQDLRRAVAAPAAAGLVNDLGEIVEIRLPLLVATAAATGVAVQLALGIQVPATVFTTALTALLAVGSFFAMLRVDPPTLRRPLSSLRAAWPLLLPRLALGLVLIWAGHSLPLELAGLFLLLPPALIAPTLSLLWGGDYFFAVRHTVAASLALPALLLTGLALPLSLPGTAPTLTLGRLEPALLAYAAVLLAALVLPGVGAQALRRRDPIRAGALSTNWNWLGGLALVPVAGLATFALTPPTGLTAHTAIRLLLVMSAAAAALTALRLLTTLFLRLRPHGTGLGRDLFITQNTPNVFLWLAMTAVLAPTTGHRPSVIGLGVALVFFFAVYTDERIFLHAHRHDLSPSVPEAPETRKTRTIPDLLTPGK